MDSSLVVLLATLVAFVSGCWYALLTAQGKTRPNRVTFALWFLFPLVIFSAQMAQGLFIAALPTLAAGLPSLLTVLMSYKNPAAYWRLRPHSFVFGCIGLGAIPLWIITDEPNLALTLALIANMAAFVPTLVKAYVDPSSEDYRPYMLSAGAFFFAILFASDYSFAAIGFMVYLCITNTVLTILARRQQVI